MNSVNLENAKSIQAKKQVRAIIAFFAASLAIIVLIGVLFFKTPTFIQEPKLLLIIAAVLFVAAVNYTKIYKLLERKVTIGSIIDTHIRVVNVKTNPGVSGYGTYYTQSSSEIELSITTDSGKFLLKVYPYKGSNRKLKTGDRKSVV